MKYIEIGATYKVQIPKSLSWSDDEEARRRGEKTLDDYRLFWLEKEITITQHYLGRAAGVAGTVYGRAGICYIEDEWVGEMIRHCPQVEYYIKSQEKEKYISPLTGKKT